MTVWVVVVDYGLNGAGVLAVFGHEPSQVEVDKLVRADVYQVTGYSGTDCEQWEVTP